MNSKTLQRTPPTDLSFCRSAVPLLPHTEADVPAAQYDSSYYTTFGKHRLVSYKYRMTFYKYRMTFYIDRIASYIDRMTSDKHRMPSDKYRMDSDKYRMLPVVKRMASYKHRIYSDLQISIQFPPAISIVKSK